TSTPAALTFPVMSRSPWTCTTLRSPMDPQVERSGLGLAGYVRSATWAHCAAIAAMSRFTAEVRTLGSAPDPWTLSSWLLFRFPAIAPALFGDEIPGSEVPPGIVSYGAA